MATSFQGTGYLAVREGTKLVITVDLAHNGGPSKSGKTTIIASSGGNVDVGDGVKLGLNVYRKG